jgi:hypothetical protein
VWVCGLLGKQWDVGCNGVRSVATEELGVTGASVAHAVHVDVVLLSVGFVGGDWGRGVGVGVGVGGCVAGHCWLGHGGLRGD